MVVSSNCRILVRAIPIDPHRRLANTVSLHCIPSLPFTAGLSCLPKLSCLTSESGSVIVNLPTLHFTAIQRFGRFAFPDQARQCLARSFRISYSGRFLGLRICDFFPFIARIALHFLVS
jgi:hypothetical protein